MVPLEDDPDLF